MRLVPTNRLLLAVGLVFLPLSLLVAFMPDKTSLAILVCGALVAAVIFDAFKAPGQLSGIGVRLPEIVRMSKFRNADIEIFIENEKLQPGRIRLGLTFPAAVYSPIKELVTRLPSDSTHSILRWPCKGLQQGNCILDKCFLETTSPKGFWNVRTSFPARLELRVYPNLLVERKNLSSLF